MLSAVVEKSPYRCKICKPPFSEVHYPTLHALKRHFMLQHAEGKNANLICNIDGCPVMLRNKRSFNNHIRKHHPGKEWYPYPSISVSTTRPTLIHVPNLIQQGQDNNEAHDLSVKTVATINTGNTLHSQQLIDTGILAESSEEMISDSNVGIPVPVTDEIPASSDTVCHLSNSAGPATDEIPSSTSSDTVCHLSNSAVPSSSNFTCFCHEDDDVESYLSHTSATSKQRQLQALVSLLELRSNYNLTRAAMNGVVEWHKQSLLNAVRSLVGCFKHNFSLPQPAMEPIINFASDLVNPFQGIESDWMMNKALEELGLFVVCMFSIKN